MVDAIIESLVCRLRNKMYADGSVATFRAQTD